MKLPPSSPPSDGPPNKFTYTKDKTLTKRTVKGAGGGMIGVDYEDSRRADPNTVKRPSVEELQGRERPSPRQGEGAERAQVANFAREEKVNPGKGKDEALVVLDDEEAPSAHRRSRRRHVARDRLHVDKDPPELIRHRRWEDDEPEDEFEEQDEQEIEFRDAMGAADSPRSSRAHLFNQEHRPQPGDPSLTDPTEIQRALGSPASYAKHVMILAEAFRRSTGALREEAVEYLARMFVALPDRSFGRVSLKEFGPSTGIIDVYPLEVTEHILEQFPGFLPKVGFGRLFHRSGATERSFTIDTQTALILEYPEQLKIRGFAIKGGGRPGYVFQPMAEDPGAYSLEIHTPGSFEVLVSATNRAGYTMVDRLRVEVRLAKGEHPRGEPKGEDYPLRDEERVRSWPIPARPDPLALLELGSTQEAEARSERGLLSAAELAWRQAADAIGEGSMASGPFLIEARGEPADDAAGEESLALEDQDEPGREREPPVQESLEEADADREETADLEVPRGEREEGGDEARERAAVGREPVPASRASPWTDETAELEIERPPSEERSSPWRDETESLEPAEAPRSQETKPSPWLDETGTLEIRPPEELWAQMKARDAQGAAEDTEVGVDAVGPRGKPSPRQSGRAAGDASSAGQEEGRPRGKGGRRSSKTRPRAKAPSGAKPVAPEQASGRVPLPKADLPKTGGDPLVSRPALGGPPGADPEPTVPIDLDGSDED